MRSRSCQEEENVKLCDLENDPQLPIYDHKTHHPSEAISSLEPLNRLSQHACIQTDQMDSQRGQANMFVQSKHKVELTNGNL